MPHALVIGGTGMLRGLCLELAHAGNTVSVIARHKGNLERLAKEHRVEPFSDSTKSESINSTAGKINTIDVDYRQYASLRKAVSKAIDEFGSIDLCVSWIHSNAPDAVFIAAEVLNNQNLPVRFIELFGGAAADPSSDSDLHFEQFKQYRNVEFQAVILGFIHKGNHSRWLTDGEIVEGTLKAIDTKARLSIIGP